MSAARGMVIVGAGECGVRAAYTLREAGWAGPITLVGAEDVLPLERPPLSKSVLTEASDPPALCDAEGLRQAGIAYLAGVAATDIDRDHRELLLADGRRIGYERLLLATGANPRQLPLSGGADGVHCLRSYGDALALRQRMRPGAHLVVIGGGFLGLEVAASATGRGGTVSVVEVAPQVLSRVVPPEVAAVVAERHRRAGVDLRCGSSVAGVDHQHDRLRVELADGDSLTCDTVVIAVGAVPETTLADKAGLAVDNGVRVDSRLATSDPDIFAAGDCCSFPHPLYDDRRIRLEAWRNARDQGVAAARNMLDADQPFTAVPWFWSDQYDLTLQIAGLPDAATSEVVRLRRDGVEIRFGLGQQGRLLAASAVGEGNAVAKDIRLGEMLIARRACPDPAALTDPAVNLKTLLREAH